MKRSLDRDSAANSLGENETKQFENAISTNKQAFVYFCLGKFGMRIGEMSHMTHDWFVLTPNQEHIKIPPSTKCIHECKLCKKRGGMWSPKTKNGARTIPGRIDIEAFWFIESYLKSGNIPPMERRARDIIYTIEKKAQIRHNVFPHALRATAAQRVATMPDITAPDLMGIFGWSNLEIANEYIKSSGVNVLKRFTKETIEVTSETNTVIDNLGKSTEYKVYNDSQASFKCSVCDSDVLVQQDGTWKCRECGAESEGDK